MPENIPATYAFLSAIGPMPPTIVQALALLGTNEMPGRDSSDVIESWRDEINAVYREGIQGFSDDSVPWCGLFAAVVTHRAGSVPITNPLWARNWANYGDPVDDPHLGDVLVFQREGGGHVGFYVAEDADHYHVLGGNQSDSVTITRIAKDRCIATRRAPEPALQVASAKGYTVAANGRVSTNEA